MDIPARVSNLEVSLESHRVDLQGFRSESQDYRDINHKSISGLQGDMSVIVAWVTEEKARRRFIKGTMKAAAWLLGMVATSLAVVKGIPIKV